MVIESQPMFFLASALIRYFENARYERKWVMHGMRLAPGPEGEGGNSAPPPSGYESRQWGSGYVYFIAVPGF